MFYCSPEQSEYNPIIFEMNQFYNGYYNRIQLCLSDKDGSGSNNKFYVCFNTFGMNGPSEQCLVSKREYKDEWFHFAIINDTTNHTLSLYINGIKEDSKQELLFQEMFGMVMIGGGQHLECPISGYCGYFRVEKDILFSDIININNLEFDTKYRLNILSCSSKTTKRKINSFISNKKDTIRKIVNNDLLIQYNTTRYIQKNIENKYNSLRNIIGKEYLNEDTKRIILSKNSLVWQDLLRYIKKDIKNKYNILRNISKNNIFNNDSIRNIIGKEYLNKDTKRIILGKNSLIYQDLLRYVKTNIKNKYNILRNISKNNIFNNDIIRNITKNINNYKYDTNMKLLKDNFTLQQDLIKYIIQIILNNNDTIRIYKKKIINNKDTKRKILK